MNPVRIISLSIFLLVVACLTACSSSGDTSKGPDAQEITAYFQKENQKKLEKLKGMAYGLLENGSYRLPFINETLEPLTDLHRQIGRTITNPSVSSKAPSELLREVSALQAELDSTQELADSPNFLHDPLLQLLAKEAQMLEMAEQKLWDEFLLAQDKRLRVISFTEQAENAGDTIRLIVGVNQGGITPFYSIKYGRIQASQQIKGFAQITATRADLADRKVEVQVKVPQLRDTSKTITVTPGLQAETYEIP